MKSVGQLSFNGFYLFFLVFKAEQEFTFPVHFYSMYF